MSFSSASKNSTNLGFGKQNTGFNQRTKKQLKPARIESTGRGRRNRPTPPAVIKGKSIMRQLPKEPALFTTKLLEFVQRQIQKCPNNTLSEINTQTVLLKANVTATIEEFLKNAIQSEEKESVNLVLSKLADKLLELTTNSNATDEIKTLITNSTKKTANSIFTDDLCKFGSAIPSSTQPNNTVDEFKPSIEFIEPNPQGDNNTQSNN